MIIQKFETTFSFCYQIAWCLTQRLEKFCTNSSSIQNPILASMLFNFYFSFTLSLSRSLTSFQSCSYSSRALPCYWRRAVYFFCCLRMIGETEIIYSIVGSGLCWERGQLQTVSGIIVFDFQGNFIIDRVIIGMNVKYSRQQYKVLMIILQLNNKNNRFYNPNKENTHFNDSIRQKIDLLETMQKLSNFFIKSTEVISESTLASIQDLTQDINRVNLSPLQNDQQIKTKTDDVSEPVTSNDIVEIIPLTVDKISIQRPLENIKLEQSNIIQLESKVSSQRHLLKKSRSENASFKQSISTSRIKQIEEQKKRILEELKKLDEEIVQIKKENNDSLQKSRFVKKVEISDDIEAKRQAQSLIKQLHLQKKKIQEKKRRQQEKELQERKREQEQKKRERQEMDKRIKEQKRQLIEKRMEDEKRKKEQRRLIEKQSNLLIQELKKQQKLEKQRELIPGQILEYELKKKLLEKKQLFNISQIEQHEQKYRQLKSKEKQLRRERSSSIKLSYPIPKFGKNIWGEKLEQQQIKKKEEQKLKQLGRKMQLQKRMKYGDIVKNILKSKQKKKEESAEKPSKDQSFQQPQTVTMKKPQTPDVNSHLPKIQNTELKRQNKTDKTFKQRNQSNIIIGEKKSRVVSNSKQKPKERDPEELQKIQRQKQRQLQLRKQTKQRLKKLQTKSIDIPKPQKVKYENYIGQVKIKKAGPEEEWKKIMQNEKLSKEQKYKQMLSKAAYMQSQARIKEDLRKNGDEDAVNLYIGSIQAKLALLQKF